MLRKTTRSVSLAATIRFSCVLGGGACLFEQSAAAQSTVLYVDADVAVSGDGSSWATAFKSLQEALDIPLNNPLTSIRQIWVAEGTYYPTKPVDPANLDPRAKTFLIKRERIEFQQFEPANLGIFGGFRGDETDLNQRNPICHVTILSGDIGVPGSMADNAYHVVSCLRTLANDTDVTPNLDGFIIEKGNATGAPVITLKSPGTPHPDDPVGFSADSGGGMVVIGRVFNNVEISNPNITRCIFRNNLADAASGYGGGVFIRSRQGTVGTQQFLDCTFHDNSAHYGGAAALPDNQEDNDPNRVTPRFANCLFHHNSATEGGAVFSSRASAPHIYESTVANNTSGIGSGAVYHETGIGGTFTINNTILWGNVRGASTTDAQAQLIGGVFAVTWSDIQGWTLVPGENNTNFDPLFKNPAAIDWDFRLRCGSPVIDSATPNDPEADPLDINQDGNGGARRAGAIRSGRSRVRIAR